jgi:hypothetical protein
MMAGAIASGVITKIADATKNDRQLPGDWVIIFWGSPNEWSALLTRAAFNGNPNQNT